ncbi:hypothetical protein ABPG74_007375 [Tetrahymena malaccensis]
MGNYLSFLQIKKEKTTEMPFKNKQVEEIAKKFLLSPQDMIFFHSVFRKMDKLGNGYISEDSMFEFVQEEKTSVLSPYITKLFQLIEKEIPDRVCFIEWVPAICAFCLFTHEQIIKFVFCMIDDDHDEVISKKDIIKFLVKERYGEEVFPFNQVKAIELLDVDRADRIKFEQFKRIEQQIPFLCYPAFRLQQIFKEQIKGNTFWKKIFQAILQQEQEREKQKQQEIIDEQVNKKKKIELAKKEQNFQQQFQNKKIDQNIFKPNFLYNTRISLLESTYKYPRSNSVQRIQTTQNQDFILIDYKSVINQRRMSDGMVDSVFLPLKPINRQVREESMYYGDEVKKLEFPTLDMPQLKRVNSQLYIKQPFTNNPYTFDKNDEQNMINIKSVDGKKQRYPIQSLQPNSPKNQDMISPRIDNSNLQSYSKQLQQGIQQQIKKRNNIPRSLKNPQNVEPNLRKQFLNFNMNSNFLTPNQQDKQQNSVSQAKSK